MAFPPRHATWRRIGSHDVTCMTSWLLFPPGPPRAGLDNIVALTFVSHHVWLARRCVACGVWRGDEGARYDSTTTITTTTTTTIISPPHSSISVAFPSWFLSLPHKQAPFPFISFPYRRQARTREEGGYGTASSGWEGLRRRGAGQGRLFAYPGLINKGEPGSGGVALSTPTGTAIYNSKHDPPAGSKGGEARGGKGGEGKRGD